MKTFYCSFWILVLTTTAYSGNNEELTKLFSQAEAYFNDEKYAQALPLYLTIESMNNETGNINFKIGICYLFSSNEKSKAIPYLLTATKNSLVGTKENSLKEKNAPITSYYYLAQAYHINYQFDNAIANYEKFKTYIPADQEMIRNVNQQISMCKYGKELVAKPIKTTIINLGPNINSKYADFSPVLSADESTIIFTSRREGSTGNKTDENGLYFEDVYIAQKKDSLHWESATNIGNPINTDGHEATIGLSVDGQKLIIYKDDKGDGNIYISNLNGEKWSEPQKMNENINTPDWEPSASFSADGEMLYFSSNRPGWGGRDIYRSRKLPNGQWAKAQNLGSQINTPYDEDAPFIHPDGKTLYFSSTGHKNMGGFDIFYSTLSDSGTWSEPQNLGYPINTTEDDVFFVITPDNKRAYFSSVKAEGYGEKDIYMLTLPDLSENSLTVYRGEIKNQFGEVPEDVIITVIDNETEEVIGEYFPNSSTGKFLFILQPGKNYNVRYEAEGFLFQSQNLEVPKESAYTIVNAAIELDPLTVGSKVILKNLFFDNNTATIKSISYVELDKLYKLLNKYQKLIVEISGHTDSKGSDDYNLQLSQERAENVVKYLVERGIKRERMLAKGYGKTTPITSNETEEGRKLNRRVEYKILSTTGEVDIVEKIKVPENLAPKK